MVSSVGAFFLSQLSAYAVFFATDCAQVFFFSFSFFLLFGLVLLEGVIITFIMHLPDVYHGLS